MINITLRDEPTCHKEGIFTRIARGLAAHIAEWRMAAKLKMLEPLPPYLLSDMGLPGFHLMTPDSRKAALRVAFDRTA